MCKYILLRTSYALIVLLSISMLTFALGRLTPGDPTAVFLYNIQNPTPEDIQAARETMGLDRPIALQYISWLSAALTGDLGISHRSHYPIIYEISTRLPATLLLMAGSLVTMLVVGFTFGILSALHHNKIPDYLIRLFNIVALSIPAFCMGIFLTLMMRGLPIVGAIGLNRLILPSLTIGLGAGAGFARLIRAQIIAAMNREFVKAAMVFGVSRPKVILNNVVKNAMPPIVTNIGLFIGSILGGSAIIESLFSWPGVGRYAVDAIFGRDYPVIQAYALLMAAVYIIVNLLTDIINRLFVPAR